LNRLLSAEISGFRAFASDQPFDLDADVVILSGPNGSGKTSFFDSILWALSGRLPRFSGRKPNAISLYSPSGTARVALTFRDSDGENLTVIRTASSEEHSDALVETTTGRFEGSAAEVKILESFWPSALQTKDSTAAFSGPDDSTSSSANSREGATRGAALERNGRTNLRKQRAGLPRSGCA